MHLYLLYVLLMQVHAGGGGGGGGGGGRGEGRLACLHGVLLCTILMVETVSDGDNAPGKRCKLCFAAATEPRTKFIISTSIY